MGIGSVVVKLRYGAGWVFLLCLRPGLVPQQPRTFSAFIVLLTETLEAGGNKVCPLLSSVCLFAWPLWPISGADVQLCMCREFAPLQSIETIYWRFRSDVLALLLGRVCLATVRITRGKLLYLSCTVRHQEPTNCGAVDHSTVE